MTIGLLGAGSIGQAIAGHVARAGYEVILSNRRGPGSLAEVASQLGSSVKAGTPQEAAQPDFVVLAVRWPRVRKVLAGAPTWSGRILIDSTNPMVRQNCDSPWSGQRCSGAAKGAPP